MIRVTESTYQTDYDGVLKLFNTTKLYTVDDICALCNFSRGWFFRLVRENKFKSPSGKAGRLSLWTQADIDAAINSGVIKYGSS